MVAFIAYLFYFIAASASPLQRRYLAVKRGADSRGQINFAFKVTGIIVALSLVLPFFQPFYLRGNLLYLLILSLCCGIFGAGFFISSYVAQKHVDAGITTLVSNIYTPVTIILATLFLNEKLSPTQIVGTLLLLASILIISKKHQIGRLRFDKYFLYMIASGIMLGITLTSERTLIKTSGFTAGTMLSWWSQCAFLAIAAYFAKSNSTYTTKDTFITGVLRFFQSLSWVILIFVVGNLSVVSAITTFKVVVIFVAAAIFLKERDNIPRKMIGSIIAVIGLLLMR